MKTENIKKIKLSSVLNILNKKLLSEKYDFIASAITPFHILGAISYINGSCNKKIKLRVFS